MKKIISTSWLVGMSSLAIVFTLSSFVMRRGGDSYSISVNGKQVIQYFVASKKELPSLSVNTASNDKLTIYYSECGKIGNSRKLSLRNEKNQVLKEWKYANVADEQLPMSLNASDLNLSGGSGLYYSSDEVSTPRKLASINLVNNTAAASR